MAELESSIQRRCQKVLKDNDAFVFKTHGDMYSRIGIPDLVACIPVTEEVVKILLEEGWFKNNKVGIFLGLEVKRVGKLNVFDDRRKAQEIVGREIKNAGGLWFAIDDSEMVEALIKKIKGEL